MSLKVLYNYNCIFFLECFDQYLKKSTNGFPIVFSNFQSPRADNFLEIDPYIFRVLGPILAI